jgi:hypothetical protein
MRRSIVLVGLALLTVGSTSCVAMPGDSMGDRPWVPPVSAGAGGVSQQPMALPAEVYTSENVNIPEVIEKHGVVNFNDCKRMEARFKQAGRKIRLTDVKPNLNRGATLFWICWFKGEDAQEGYFEDTRYNSSQEYDY